MIVISGSSRYEKKILQDWALSFRLRKEGGFTRWRLKNPRQARAQWGWGGVGIEWFKDSLNETDTGTVHFYEAFLNSCVIRVEENVKYGLQFVLKRSSVPTLGE